MRQVKCRACGKKIDIDAAFQGSPRMYYCSEQEYKIELKFWNTVYEFIGNTKNTLLFKEAALWGSHSKVLSFMQDNKAQIEQSMARSFDSEYKKIRYFSAIIKNNIADYVPSQPEIEHQVSDEIYDCKYKPKKRRKCLRDYFDEMDDDMI